MNKKNAISEKIKIIPHAAIAGEKFDLITNTPNILSKKIKKNPRETPIAKLNPIPPLCLKDETETPIIERIKHDKGRVYRLCLTSRWELINEDPLFFSYLINLFNSE